MSDCVTIDATSIKEGGGFVLLERLVEELQVLDIDFKIIGNQYLYDVCKGNVVVAGMLDFITLYVFGTPSCIYFCNRSPLISRGKSLTYIHNEYVTYKFCKIWKLNISFRRKVAHSVNRLTNIIASNVSRHRFVVQTNSMSERLRNQNLKCKIMPFFPSIETSQKLKDKLWDFCYVSYPWPHKNHKLLLDELLRIDSGKKLSFALTIPNDDRFDGLLEMISEINSKGVFNVVNVGSVSHDEVKRLYLNSRALLFLSTKESFGLPLIEAAQVGLPVVVPNCSYVKDVIGNVTYLDISPNESIISQLRGIDLSMLPTPKIMIRDSAKQLINEIVD